MSRLCDSYTVFAANAFYCLSAAAFGKPVALVVSGRAGAGAGSVQAVKAHKK